MPASPPRVLAVLPGFTASTLMDVVKPLMALEERGEIQFRVALEFYTRLSAIPWANLVVFCRNSEPKYEHILDFVLDRRIPYVYDLDDNLFEIPLDSELGRYYRAPERMALLSRYLQHAGLARVYSTPLETRLREMNANTRYVVAPLDWELIQAPRPRPEGSLVRIVYATSRKDDRMAQLFEPALLSALERYPRQIEVYFWGHLPDAFRNQEDVHYYKLITNYNTFLQKFSQMGFDIGLAPLVDDDFERAKTNNKFREYGACRIAGVYSAVEVYTSCIHDGETGLLVENQAQAWYSAIARLIEDRDLRQRIAQAARRQVEQDYSQERFQEVWRQQIETLLAQPRTTASPRRQSEPIQSGFPPAPGERGKGWLTGKLRQARLRLQAGGLRAILSTLGLELNNLWLLFKINRLKKL